MSGFLVLPSRIRTPPARLLRSSAARRCFIRRAPPLSPPLMRCQPTRPMPKCLSLQRGTLPTNHSGPAKYDQLRSLLHDRRQWGLADASAGAGGVLTGTAVGTPLSRQQPVVDQDRVHSPAIGHRARPDLTLFRCPHTSLTGSSVSASWRRVRVLSDARRRCWKCCTSIAQPTAPADPAPAAPVLKAGPYGDLPLQPGNGGLTGLRFVQEPPPVRRVAGRLDPGSRGDF